MRTFPDGWFAVSAQEADAFAMELHREVSSAHPLYGKSLLCLARRKDRDDFLFQSTSEAACYVVHLTWSPEKAPDFPWVTCFIDVQDFDSNWKRIFE